jgi:hypothetical protein
MIYIFKPPPDNSIPPSPPKGQGGKPFDANVDLRLKLEKALDAAEQLINTMEHNTKVTEEDRKKRITI